LPFDPSVFDFERRFAAYAVVDTEPRKVPKRIASTLLAEQVSIVLSEVPEQYRAFFATAVFTGMRKGELCGLRNADVDLVERTITVRRFTRHDEGRTR
jgi:integrase